MSRGGVLLHDNGMPHKAALVNGLLANFGWSGTYPSDFTLFMVLKNALGRKWFQLHVEVEIFVKSFLANLEANTILQGDQKVLPTKILKFY